MARGGPRAERRDRASDAPKKRRRPITSEEALKDLALSYAIRYPGTVEKMRRYLGQKMRDAVAANECPESNTRPWIDAVIATLLRIKVLDDSLFAGIRAHSLQRRGRSLSTIARDLKHKETAPAAIEGAIDELRAESDNPDWTAALSLARKKRLGPFGSGLQTTDRTARMKSRQKQLATLGRAGFGFDIARRIVDAPDLTALEDEDEDR